MRRNRRRAAATSLDVPSASKRRTSNRDLFETADRGIDLDSTLATTIAERGWAYARHFLDRPVWSRLAEELRLAERDDKLRPAGLGARQRYRVVEDIRGDRIQWLGAAACSEAQAQALSRLEELRLACNRELQLGLLDFEGHLALYPAGSYYRRHRDQPVDSDARVLSCLLYLNDDWKQEDGGCLRLYLDDGDAGRRIDVLPEGGALVCFLSAHFFHEVLPATRDRLSLAGWFRRRQM
ncbi:MAG: 2OG-Fe(II) oxygenase [Proteobacteria bacterium]|nr:MAG: 2OG-Fe(II) oxygenase [Pseudomonadota bacterium]